MKYDVIIIGAGPGGIFSAYELMKQRPELKTAVFEAGNPLEMSDRRREGEVLHQMQYLCDHERVRRGRRIFGWKIQHYK